MIDFALRADQRARAACAVALAVVSAGCASSRPPEAPPADHTWHIPAAAMLVEAAPPAAVSVETFEARTVSELPAKPQPIMSVAAARAAGAEVFRNTYYYFPQQSDFGGKRVSIHDPSCRRIDRVPADFYAAVCVQGSGRLTDGRTVSFARNRCSCAMRCGRTGQRICFSPLDAEEFPWGRGAMGTAITPLRTIAVDSNLIPLGDTVYIPEYAGLPMDPEGKAHHDGCFLAEDRGGAVKGRHLDVFTGDAGTLELWNELVPSNQGVTVVLSEKKCEYLANRLERGSDESPPKDRPAAP